MARTRVRAGDWPPTGWSHADRELSRAASEMAGRQCFVCPGYDSDTMDPLLMVADGTHAPVLVNLVSELRAAVAELMVGLGGGIRG